MSRGHTCVHVAEVLVTDPGTGRILLVRNEGKWWLPGGKVEPGESFVAAALREVTEETGVTVEFEGVVAIEEWRKPEHDEVTVTCRCRYVAGTPRVPDGELEVDAAQWTEPAEADRLLADFPGGVARLVGAPSIPHWQK